jgi:hypothetical protein
MLFDLRARGRRRTVQVVYVGLALLFLVGFIGFGVGVGGGGGGLVEGLFGNKEGGSGGGYGKQVAAAEARTRKHPGEAAAWAQLVEARFHQSGEKDFYDEEKQQFTGKGKELLGKIAQDWDRYVALKPAAPTLAVAYDMLRVFGEEGLNQPAKTEAMLQLVIPTRPKNANLYYYLAKAAYQNKDESTGDLAAQKAIGLTPAKERARVKSYMLSLKQSHGNVSNETYTATTNGKVYSVKVNSNGEGTIVKTSPAPAKTSPAPSSTTKTPTAPSSTTKKK